MPQTADWKSIMGFISDFKKECNNFLKKVDTLEKGSVLQELLTDKISKLKKHIDDKGLEIDIEVDGGINLKTAPKVKEAGANILVAGTAILMASDYKVIIDEMRDC